MSLQVEKMEKNMAKLTIEVSAEELEKALQGAYNKQKGQISVPGFRKGKVPRQMIEKMKAAEKKIEQTKNPDKKPEDYLGNRILGLVAVGGYTFEQVYNMTMLQFNMLLQKYVDIQTFELRTSLSPYISSEEGQTNKFWLD